MAETRHWALKKDINWIIIVAALGYFVDIYDLLLFIIVRIPSLEGMGVHSPEAITAKGAFLFNVQMFGLLLGGFVWGVIGDKKGRLTVLFGSIFLYSVANVLNGFAVNIPQYAVLRFIAGFGLAGELGAGITLVAEIMPKEHRGYGTMIVAAVGILGAVVASLVANHFQWRTAFFVGGALGFILLILRISVSESGLFIKAKGEEVNRGNLWDLFGNKARLLKYFYISLIALPVWYTIGVLIQFGREFGHALHMPDLVNPGVGISFTYFGASIGNFLSGALSQWVKSRRLVVAIFIPLNAVLIFIYLHLTGASLFWYYGVCMVAGITTGFWVLFVTIAAEQFGTNLRATVTTSLPNVVRGYNIPIILGFQFLAPFVGGIIPSALILGGLSIGLAGFGLWKTSETYAKDLDYVEF